ncbi:transmembrane 6 superfamily member 2 isoform X2 [Crotalus tigris]|uniref:transmembrane 6 superfamily member 2 isoform X2 n=1 Tax=Crotalus tigris TaxID=88082 RepID=UPI00192F3151|nr:transmembrane 6 superfamily member 2 isoform X2 [Crotalus tigris]
MSGGELCVTTGNPSLGRLPLFCWSDRPLVAHSHDPLLPGLLSMPLNMRLHPLWAAVGLFLSAFPLFYLLNTIAALQSPLVTAVLGVIILSPLFVLIYLPNRSYEDPLLYVFMVLCFIAGTDAVITLEKDGYISHFADFYIREGELYLGTAYGIMISYWHAAVNFAMYLVMIAAIVQRKSYRTVGLYWTGSFIMTLIVFLLGNVIGKYSSEVRPTFLLNLLYLIIPIWAAKTFFAQPKTCPLPTADQVAEEQKKNLLQRRMDLGLVGFLLLAVVYTLFRGLVVLDCRADSCFDYVYQQEPYLRDPVAYPKIQAQFSHIAASIHHRTPFPYRIPERDWWFVVLCNVAYAVGPQLLAYRCLYKPAFFCSPVSQSKDKKNQ